MCEVPTSGSRSPGHTVSKAVAVSLVAPWCWALGPPLPGWHCTSRHREKFWQAFPIQGFRASSCVQVSFRRWEMLVWTNRRHSGRGWKVHEVTKCISVLTSSRSVCILDPATVFSCSIQRWARKRLHKALQCFSCRPRTQARAQRVGAGLDD